MVEPQTRDQPERPSAYCCDIWPPHRELRRIPDNCGSSITGICRCPHKAALPAHQRSAGPRPGPVHLSVASFAARCYLFSMMNDPIPESARAMIGKKKTRHCEVTLRDIQRFAQAIGAVDRVHHDEQYARTTRHGCIVAPPLFCQSLTYEDVPPDQLPGDGSPLELCVPIPAQRAVGGSSDYIIHRLVRAGETITVTSQLKDLYTRQGKTGLLYMVVVETVFEDADGAPVAAETATYIKRV